MQRQRVQFDNGRGQTLVGHLVEPAEHEPTAWAVFAHCFTCNKNLHAVRHIAEGLARHGMGVMSFDFTGLGESEGEFGATGFSANVADLVAAAEWLSAEKTAPALLVGHSLGGAAVLAAAPRIASVRAVATIGAPADPEHVTQLFQDKVDTIEAQGAARVSIGGRPFQLTREFLRDLRDAALTEHLHDLDRALLLFHAPADRVVGIEHARRIYDAASHPKSFVALDGGDHLLSDEADGRYVADVLAAWAGRYITGEKDAARAEATAPDPGQHQVAARIGPEPYATRIRSGSHALSADEPTDAGGADTGPSPYDLLLAALGACTAITLRMYADRKRWPLEHATVRLTHERLHAKDCDECESEAGYVSTIERAIELAGDLDADQRQRLLEIAEKCPVHRTLTGEVRVTSRLE